MESILENGKSIQKAEGILSSEFNDGKAMIELGSGKYEFTEENMNLRSLGDLFIW